MLLRLTAIFLLDLSFFPFDPMLITPTRLFPISNPVCLFCLISSFALHILASVLPRFHSRSPSLSLRYLSSTLLPFSRIVILPLYLHLSPTSPPPRFPSPWYLFPCYVQFIPGPAQIFILSKCITITKNVLSCFNFFA